MRSYRRSRASKTKSFSHSWKLRSGEIKVLLPASTRRGARRALRSIADTRSHIALTVHRNYVTRVNVLLVIRQADGKFSLRNYPRHTFAKLLHCNLYDARRARTGPATRSHARAGNVRTSRSFASTGFFEAASRVVCCAKINVTFRSRASRLPGRTRARLPFLCDRHSPTEISAIDFVNSGRIISAEIFPGIHQPRRDFRARYNVTRKTRRLIAPHGIHLCESTIRYHLRQIVISM